MIEAVWIVFAFTLGVGVRFVGLRRELRGIDRDLSRARENMRYEERRLR